MTIINGEDWIMAKPPVPANLDAWLGQKAEAFKFLDEQEEIARAMAEETGMPWKLHLDEAWDLVLELRTFAKVWDLCAVSQGHEGV